MTCAEVRDRFLDRHYQLLDEADAATVDRHVAECADCARAWAAVPERVRLLDAWQPEGPAPGLADRTVAVAERATGGPAESTGSGTRRGAPDVPPNVPLAGPVQGGPAPARPSLFRRGLRWTAAALVLASVSLLGGGVYVDAVGPNPQEMIVLSETELLSGAPASIRVVVRDHRDGRPIAGADVVVGLRRIAGPGEGDPPSRSLGMFRTEATGSGDFRFDVPDLEPGDYRLTLEGASSLGADRLERPVRVRRPFACFLGTDKPLYQPGQTIHLRVLALRLPGRTPVAGQEALFTVHDAKGNLVYKRVERTSEFGIAATDFGLASEVLLGRWRIGVQVADTRSERTVEVKRYVLPEFKVAVTTEQSFARPGSRIAGRLEARYFFGKAVAGGRVAWEACVEGEERPFGSLAGTCDADGAMPFQLDLPEVLAGAPVKGGDAAVRISATVTDGAGHREVGHARVIVSAADLRALVVPAQNATVGGVENEYFVLAAYPDGTPARAAATLTFVAGQTPLSAGEAKGTTDEAGVARLRAVPPANATGVRVHLDDGRGHAAEASSLLERDPRDAAFLAWTERSVYQAGETLRLHVLRPGADGTVYVDVVHEGRTVVTRDLTLKDGKGLFELDLGDDLAGALEIHAWRLLPTGEFVRETRLVRVLADGALDVRLTLDRESYKPGETARLRWQVLDRKGAPTAAALGIAAVDEKVFALAEEHAGLEAVHAAIEEDLLRPLMQIKYPWSPALLRRSPEAAAAALAVAAQPYDALSRSQVVQLERTAAMLESRMRDPQSRARLLADPTQQRMLEQVRKLRFARVFANTYDDKVAARERERGRYRRFAGDAWGWLGTAALALFMVWGLAGAWDRGGGSLLRLVGCTGLAVAVLAALLLPALSDARKGGRLAPGSEVPVTAAPASDAGPATTGDAPARLREHFPELLYWNPALVTDAEGRAEIEIPLADSITTWRISQSAVARDGRIGASTSGLRVFQDFFVDLDLPLFLTEGDEAALPVAIHNHLDRAQTVTVRLESEDGFEFLDAVERTVAMPAGEVGAAVIRVRARRFGSLPLTVHARGDAGLADAVRRTVTVRPNGTERSVSASGRLRREEEVVFDLPANAIPGTEDVLVRLFPSRFSEVVNGLESMVRLPHG